MHRLHGRFREYGDTVDGGFGLPGDLGLGPVRWGGSSDRVYQLGGLLQPGGRRELHVGLVASPSRVRERRAHRRLPELRQDRRLGIRQPRQVRKRHPRWDWLAGGSGVAPGADAGFRCVQLCQPGRGQYDVLAGHAHQ